MIYSILYIWNIIYIYNSGLVEEELPLVDLRRRQSLEAAVKRVRLAIHAEKEKQAKAQWLPDLGVPNHFGKHPFSAEGLSAILAGYDAADNIMTMNEGALKLHHVDAPADLDPGLDQVLKTAYEKLEHDKSPAPDIVRMMCRGKEDLWGTMLVSTAEPTCGYLFLYGKLQPLGKSSWMVVPQVQFGSALFVDRVRTFLEQYHHWPEYLFDLTQAIHVRENALSHLRQDELQIITDGIFLSGGFWSLNSGAQTFIEVRDRCCDI